jgi:Cyclic nucleotide-binding domain
VPRRSRVLSVFGMRVESSVTSLSWIPSEAVSGPMKAGFATGLAHYDPPPPGHLSDEDLAAMLAADQFRFGNVLKAWADFEGNEVVAHGHSGGLLIGATTVRVGPLDATFQAVGMPELVYEPQIGDGFISWIQTVGGRTSVPLPRKISKPPYVRLHAPLVWTTLRLTLYADGSARRELVGASPFPRHWVYDEAGDLALKAGVADWKHWLGQPSWSATPWGAEDSPVVSAAAETGLERELSAMLMRGAHRPKVHTLKTGDVLARQGDAGESLFLVLDGILEVTVDGEKLGDLGPGAVVGERAVLDSSPRTATLTALTPVRAAEAPADTVDRSVLAELATGHRREAAEHSVSS